MTWEFVRHMEKVVRGKLFLHPPKKLLDIHRKSRCYGA